MSVPNQKFVFINKLQTNSNKEKFYVLSHNSFRLAFERLNKSGLSVYMYLLAQIPHTYDGQIYSKNNSEKGYELSPQAIYNYYDKQLTIQSIHNGIKQLIEFKYLTLIGGNVYQFNEILDEDKIDTVEEKQEAYSTYNHISNSLELLEFQRQQRLQKIAEKDKNNPWPVFND